MNTKEMNFTNMNIKDFIDYIITFDNIDDILDNCKTQSEKGFIFERLFDIVIKFGFCDVFTNYNFNHLSGNSTFASQNLLKQGVINHTSGHMPTSTLLSFLYNKKVRCSDITLQNNNDNIYIYIY